ncbi:LuxR C-terminal-related transcriptional regulator [Streptomyces sp. 8N706]|uniref:LuxR C-terminal-related transcriptional regulator n=1 Tax=Streptomyces sp. 8N706 TaxID=3457416 RepID=UPI003FD123D3
MGYGWPMTGRDEELLFIESRMRRTDGQPRGVVLAGEQGVGKTRLAQEALAAAGRRGAATAWAAATASARSLPLGAFSGLLGAAGPDPAHMVQQALAALLARAGRGGVVVGVDDAHLLDELSSLLVHQLALTRAVTLVVTLRAGAQAPDAVTALWKDGLLDRLDVRPLSEPESAALLEAALAGPVDSAGAARMWALTRGNALFLRHLVDGELESRRLHRAGGIWRWSGTPQVSPVLGELVAARMGQLSESVRRVVDVLALGEPLGVALLGKIVDPGAVERAEESGLVCVERDGSRLEARLAHPLYGELQRKRLGQLATRRLRGRIATALAATGGRRADDVLRRAILVVDSDLAPDPRLLTDAAQHAIGLLDLTLAERLARAAVRGGGGFDTRLSLASALSWLNRPAEAEAELASLSREAATDDVRVMIAVPRAANMFWSGRDPAGAETVLNEAAARVTDLGAQHVLGAVRAAFDAFLGRADAAVERGRSALAWEALPDQAVVMASFGVVGGLGALGRADGIGTAASRAYTAAARSFDAAVPAFGLSDLHMIGLRIVGRLDEVEDIARARQRLSAQVPGPLQPMGVALLGHAALYRGRLRSAVRLLREARAGLAPMDQGFVVRCLMSLTEALALTGDAKAARQALTEMEAERHPGVAFLDTECVLARAWVAAAEGAVGEAVALARQAASLASGRPGCELFALHTAVRLGDRTGAGRLAELAPMLDGPRAPVAAAQSAALAADDASALSVASTELLRMGDLPAAVDAAAQAAAVHRRQGRSAAAQSAAAKAHQLADACEGARTPALIAAGRPLTLTDREREAVILAAQGLSNREIAARFVVSVRTVEGHLYRAYAKLGTTNRAELHELLFTGHHDAPRAPSSAVE